MLNDSPCVRQEQRYRNKALTCLELSGVAAEGGATECLMERGVPWPSASLSFCWHSLSIPIERHV